VRLAGTHLGDGIELLAAVTLDQVQVRPDLPVDFLPRNTVCFSHKSNELFQIPVPVNYVLCSHLAVAINEVCALAASQYFALLLRKQLVAVGALVEIVFLLLKKQFELLHKESTHNLVLALLEDVKPVEAHFLCHLSNDVRIDAGHIDLDSTDFFNVFPDEVKAFSHEAINLEEFCRDQNRDGILDVKLGPAIQHDS